MRDKLNPGMDLIEALELLRRPTADDAPRLRIFLGCGFTPLHLQTFLAAELRRAFPGHLIEVSSGLFGDLPGNLERLQRERFDAAAVAFEWPDFDARLGIRNLGGWLSTDLFDVVDSVRQRAARIGEMLRRLSQSTPVVCSMPTLPLPAMFPPRTQESGIWELQLREIMASLAASVSQASGIRLVSAQALDEASPMMGRFNPKSEIMAGFPYHLPHASVLAGSMARLIHNPVPKKGLITDLDDTLWSGILGEAGIDNVCWSLDRHAQEHGLYQQFLSSLASAGVLIAVASKNDKALVERVFERKDIILRKDHVYPLEAHWSPKSASIRRILKHWNIGGDSVVFLDDSPMETAEVKAAFPEIECFTFPKGNYQAVWDLLKQLRDLFGKSTVSEEDRLRLQSIRNAGVLQESLEAEGSLSDGFLEQAKASIAFVSGKGPDGRALDLINKTNQFNLNGRRLTEGEWSNYLGEMRGGLLTANYEDKYGPLGKIAALLFKYDGKALRVDSWVISCRAFSRRIEHQCLKYLFEKYDVDEIEFDYRATDRNGPLQEFFMQLTGINPVSPLKISRTAFFEKMPRLFHRLEETNHV
jgi:FkbH-like protein